MTAFKRLNQLRDFCLSLDKELSDEKWNKVASLPREEWTEKSVRAIVKPSKKVKKNASKEE